MFVRRSVKNDLRSRFRECLTKPVDVTNVHEATEHSIRQPRLLTPEPTASLVQRELRPFEQMEFFGLELQNLTGQLGADGSAGACDEYALTTKELTYRIARQF